MSKRAPCSTRSRVVSMRPRAAASCKGVHPSANQTRGAAAATLCQLQARPQPTWGARLTLVLVVQVRPGIDQHFAHVFVVASRCLLQRGPAICSRSSGGGSGGSSSSGGDSGGSGGGSARRRHRYDSSATMLGWARAFVRLVHIDPWPLEQHDDPVKVSFGRGVVQRLAPGHAGHHEQQPESLHTRCGPHTGRADWAGRCPRGCREVWTLANAVAVASRPAGCA